MVTVPFLVIGFAIWMIVSSLKDCLYDYGKAEEMLEEEKKQQQK